LYSFSTFVMNPLLTRACAPISLMDNPLLCRSKTFSLITWGCDANVCCGKQKTNKQTKSGETSGPTNVAQRLKAEKTHLAILWSNCRLSNVGIAFYCLAARPVYRCKFWKFSNLATVHQLLKNNWLRIDRQTAAVATMQLKSTQTFFVRVVHVVLREKETTILKNSCKFRGRLHVNLGLLKQIENQIRSVTKKPIRFLRLQGRACDWSKHNEHFRNILCSRFCSFECNS